MTKLQLLFIAFVLANKSLISLRCVAPHGFQKPQRGDKILEHLIEGQCVVEIRFLSDRSKTEILVCQQKCFCPCQQKCFCPCKQKLNFFTVRCTFLIPQATTWRGDSEAFDRRSMRPYQPLF